MGAQPVGQDAARRSGPSIGEIKTRSHGAATRCFGSQWGQRRQQIKQRDFALCPNLNEAFSSKDKSLDPKPCFDLRSARPVGGFNHKFRPRLPMLRLHHANGNIGGKIR